MEGSHDSGTPDDLAAVSDAAATTRPMVRRRRARHPLLIAGACGLLAVIVLGILYGRVYAKRAALLRLQQACLGYSAPASRVVYDEEPSRAAQLLVGGGEYVASAGDGPPVAGHVPFAWRGMRKWVLPGSPAPRDAVLFLHERQTRIGGKRLLVCVEADRLGRKLRITVVHPGASTLDPSVVTDIELTAPPQPGLIVLKAAGDPFDAKLPAPNDERADLRFFAGQSDVTDTTRFNLPYEFNGQPGEFDCWLEDERVVYFVDRRFETKKAG